MLRKGSNYQFNIRFFIAVFSIAFSPIAAYSDSFAQNGFFSSELNVPGSFKRINAPTNLAPSQRVDSFTVEADFCSQKKYGDNLSSDCKWQSVRSMAVEDVWKHGVLIQPNEQWYGWYMYLDDEFPIRAGQVSGQYIFAQFHNGECPHLAFANRTFDDSILYLVTNRARGGYECTQVDKIKVLDLKEIRGKWVRFEMYVRWSETDGYTEVYVDGKKVAELHGRNLTLGFTNKNNFHYGIYLCCTAGIGKVKTATALFANVSSAKVRERLK